MSTRTVRLDDEAEATLAKLQERLGLTISELLKRGLFSLEKSTADTSSKRAWAIYEELELGPGGYALAPARDAKKAVREIIAKKHRQRTK